MRAICRFIGCALCLAGIGSAAASSLDNHELDGTPQTIIDSSGQHEGGGDGNSLNRDCPPSENGDGNNRSSTGSSGSPIGGASATPSSPRRSHLGWQSLLPGSIQ